MALAGFANPRAGQCFYGVTIPASNSSFSGPLLGCLRAVEPHSGNQIEVRLHVVDLPNRQSRCRVERKANGFWFVDPTQGLDGRSVETTQAPELFQTLRDQFLAKGWQTQLVDVAKSTSTSGDGS